MTNPTLERASRAAVAAEQDQWDLPAEQWDIETLERHGLIKIARAVILAIREPDDAVVMAGICERHKSNNTKAWSKATAKVYTAMIDAILGENDDNA